VYEDVNPANKKHILAKFRLSTKDDAKEAVKRAYSKFQEWAKLPSPRRGTMLMKAGEIMEAEAEDLSLLLTLEEGKTLRDSRTEVARSYNLFKFYGALAFKHGGITLPSADDNTRIFTLREPLGVVALITPWNFPISIPSWKMAPALAAGNTVIIKPATKTPLIVAKLIDILRRAGVPEGVVNLVVGRGGEVGDAIVKDEDVAAVSFTGSTEVGKRIYSLVGTKGRMTRVQLELGGKNGLYVDKEADLGLAADLAVRGAFTLTGQSCTATSRVIVHSRVYGEFKQRLMERLKRWRVGEGTQDVDMGPVVDESQFRKDLEYVEVGKAEGAKLVHGGSTIPGEGYFVEPTVFEGVSRNMRLFKEEIFGPILGITEAKDFDEAIELVNAVDYGHTAGIVSRDLKAINDFVNRVEAGVIKVNKPTIGLELQAPFGGFKNSGAATWKEMGEEALEFYSREKTVYEGW